MAGDCVHELGVPLSMLVWRRTVTPVFFWANHLGIYPAASVSLRAHRRLDTVVASITSTASTIIGNILISVITLIQTFQGDLSHLACVCMVQSGQCDPVYGLSKSYLSISLQYLHSWQHGTALSAAHQTVSISEPAAEAIILQNTDCSLSTASLTVEEKKKDTFSLISQVQLTIMKWCLIATFAF